MLLDKTIISISYFVYRISYIVKKIRDKSRERYHIKATGKAGNWLTN